LFTILLANVKPFFKSSKIILLSSDPHLTPQIIPFQSTIRPQNQTGSSFHIGKNLSYAPQLFNHFAANDSVINNSVILPAL